MDKYYKGKIKGIYENSILIDFDSIGAVEDARRLIEDDVSVSLKKYRDNRSIRQNSFLWACIGDIAKATNNPDNWEIYLRLLHRYGKWNIYAIPTEAIPRFADEWRRFEVLSEFEQKGIPYSQVRAYYGSSTYDTEEMAKLIDGTVSEMKEMGLKLPAPEEIQELFKGELNDRSTEKR